MEEGYDNVKKAAIKFQNSYFEDEGNNDAKQSKKSKLGAASGDDTSEEGMAK